MAVMATLLWPMDSAPARASLSVVFCVASCRIWSCTGIHCRQLEPNSTSLALVSASAMASSAWRFSSTVCRSSRIWRS